MADDIDLYDIPPVFQNRLLKWLEKNDEALTIKASAGKFLVTPRDPRTGSSTHKSLEHVLNHAIGSRAADGHVAPKFGKRVLAWLIESDGAIRISAGGDGTFDLELSTPIAKVGTSDEDLEVALVLAEDELELQTSPIEMEPETVAARTRHMPVDEEPETRAARTRRRPVEEEPETIAAPTRMAATLAAPTRIFSDDDTNVTMPSRYEANARWSRAYINSLPDSAFLHIEPGGRKDRIGRSHPLSLRHFPYKNRAGRVDQAHLRAALSRSHQGKTKLPTATKEKVFRHAQEIYAREFGGYSEELAANAPPRRRTEATLRGRALPSTDELVRREEARQRREERPFEPEAPRESYAASHHFAVNERKDILREVALGDTGYSLVLWDTHRTDRRGQSVLGYAFYEPEEKTPLFEGEDFAGSPMHADDSDETVRSLLGFLTLRPGDTDPEYFAGYSDAQLDFSDGAADMLCMWAQEPEPGYELPPLVDIE